MRNPLWRWLYSNIDKITESCPIYEYCVKVANRIDINQRKIGRQYATVKITEYFLNCNHKKQLFTEMMFPLLSNEITILGN